MIQVAITTTVLTHPFHVLFMGMILVRGVRAAISAVEEARRPGSGSHSAPVAGPSHLRAA
jgi:hypothetical protein